MTQNGVAHYVKSLVDGLESLYYAPVQAIITNDIALPQQYEVEDIGGQMLPVPFAFLWTTTTTKKRQTAPRPIAWAKRRYDFQILLSVVDIPDAPNRESAFACLIDALDIRLSTCALVVTIFDPDTNWRSQILSIGEEESTEMFLPETVGDEVGSLLRYSYRSSMVIEEAQNYAPQPPPP